VIVSWLKKRLAAYRALQLGSTQHIVGRTRGVNHFFAESFGCLDVVAAAHSKMNPIAFFRTETSSSSEQNSETLEL